MQKKSRKQNQIPTIPTADDSPTHDVDFKLERYKYILNEIHFLNESTHKLLTLFQSLSVAIVGGGIGIFISWRNLQIGADIARLAIQGTLGLLIILDLFITISIIANIFSWFDYRKEEVELLSTIASSKFRKYPSVFNFWRWSETYVLLFINLAVIVVCFCAGYGLMPLVK